MDNENNAEYSKEHVNDLIKKVCSRASETFLSRYTVPLIEKKLKKYIIGQDDLVRHTAVFLYYHALRQMYPNLKVRPLLIAGPSGSGKTEIWRVANKLFEEYFDIQVVDGAGITQDGWTGQRKLINIIGDLHTSCILVLDEFDKLTLPSYSSRGENVSTRIQAEFLKIMEGELNNIGLKSEDFDYDVGSLGLVFVGAFEDIRNKKRNKKNIGFVSKYESDKPLPDNEPFTITDEDLVEHGIMPELVGRIGDKCTTNVLSAEQYLEIIRNSNSKISTLLDVINGLGIETQSLLSDEKILELARESQSTLLGVRWVISRVESILLDAISSSDLRNVFIEKKKKRMSDDTKEDSFF